MTSTEGLQRWREKTAVVIGAASGVGAGIAATLALAGMRVVALDSREEDHIWEALKKRKHTENVIVRTCDVSDTCQLTDTFRWLDQEHGGVHALINSASVPRSDQNTDGDGDAFPEEHLNPMVADKEALKTCAIYAAASMKRNDFDGHILNIHGLTGPPSPEITDAVNEELMKYDNNIKVTSIRPATVSSEPETPTEVEHLNTGSALRLRNVVGAVIEALATPPDAKVDEVTIWPN